jgi:hypothetical protein
VTPPPPPTPDKPASSEKASQVAATSGEDDNTDSEADESDKAFTFLGYDSDPELLSALTQAADRSTDDAQRMRFIDGKPPKTTTIAKVGKQESRWMKAAPTGWSDAERNDLAKLGNTSPVYIACQTTSSSASISSSRIVCPDSGATSIMGPHCNMFSKYVDLCGKGLVVRLGDKDKTIPMAGRGTS